MLDEELMDEEFEELKRERILKSYDGLLKDKQEFYEKFKKELANVNKFIIKDLFEFFINYKNLKFQTLDNLDKDLIKKVCYIYKYSSSQNIKNIIESLLNLNNDIIAKIILHALKNNLYDEIFEYIDNDFSFEDFEKFIKKYILLNNSLCL